MSSTAKLDRLSIGVGALLVAATLLVAVFLGPDAGAVTSSMQASADTAKVTRIVIKDFKFEPVSAVVEVGTKLTFVNEDKAPHTGTAADGFDTGILDKGDEQAVTLKRPGSIAYICTVHPFMKATLKVVNRR